MGFWILAKYCATAFILIALAQAHRSFSLRINISRRLASSLALRTSFLDGPWCAPPAASLLSFY